MDEMHLRAYEIFGKLLPIIIFTFNLINFERLNVPCFGWGRGVTNPKIE